MNIHVWQDGKYGNYFNLETSHEGTSYVHVHTCYFFEWLNLNVGVILACINVWLGNLIKETIRQTLGIINRD